MNVTVRRLRADDIIQVVEIEKEAFSPLWMTTPFKREINNRYASYLVACYDPKTTEPAPAEPEAGGEASYPWDHLLRGVGNLVRRGRAGGSLASSVAGYVSVWYQGDEAHITEIAVREELRGRGIGELLLIGSLRAAVGYGSRVMTLEARVSNFIAQRLYEKYGFRSVGIRKAYYSDNREDAVIMTTSPIETEEYQQMFQDLQDEYRSRWGEIHIQA
jgi:ribosomal-protein-alanine N-acetyltransferase